MIKQISGHNVYSQLREDLRERLLAKLSDGIESKEVRRSLQKATCSPAFNKSVSYSPVPYEGFNLPVFNKTSQRDDIVFISGRFRSGSTLLWNIFRQLEGFTSYYEPFNERRWFDSGARGARVDNTHLGVSDYWEEYNGLDELGEYFDEDWIRYNLYMDENSYDFQMKRYIERLVESAVDRPVLQFNRVDFRLPWLKSNFPNAKILHIFRHPRDQWYSFLGSNSVSSAADSSLFFDGFYLGMWSLDLSAVFPFLESNAIKHPYQTFYLLWRLSHLFGDEFADYSFSMESLTESPREMTGNIFQLLGVESHQDDIYSIVKQPAKDKWKQYASLGWFEEHEAYCEKILFDFLQRS